MTPDLSQRGLSINVSVKCDVFHECHPQVGTPLQSDSVGDNYTLEVVRSHVISSVALVSCMGPRRHFGDEGRHMLAIGGRLLPQPQLWPAEECHIVAESIAMYSPHTHTQAYPQTHTFNPTD